MNSECEPFRKEYVSEGCSATAASNVIPTLSSWIRALLPGSAASPIVNKFFTTSRNLCHCVSLDLGDGGRRVFCTSLREFHLVEERRG